MSSYLPPGYAVYSTFYGQIICFFDYTTGNPKCKRCKIPRKKVRRSGPSLFIFSGKSFDALRRQGNLDPFIIFSAEAQNTLEEELLLPHILRWTDGSVPVSGHAEPALPDEMDFYSWLVHIPDLLRQGGGWKPYAPGSDGYARSPDGTQPAYGFDTAQAPGNGSLPAFRSLPRRPSFYAPLDAARLAHPHSPPLL